MQVEAPPRRGDRHVSSQAAQGGLARLRVHASIGQRPPVPSRPGSHLGQHVPRVRRRPPSRAAVLAVVLAVVPRRLLSRRGGRRAAPVAAAASVPRGPCLVHRVAALVVVAVFVVVPLPREPSPGPRSGGVEGGAGRGGVQVGAGRRRPLVLPQPYRPPRRVGLLLHGAQAVQSAPSHPSPLAGGVRIRGGRVEDRGAVLLVSASREGADHDRSTTYLSKLPSPAIDIELVWSLISRLLR
mmetsp:Transcript_48802/g.103766  ORF Transcript_48802/g.103766 Transcript_48802/m.103766 type:complete len:240 (-) Transcript_48802:72-791(-)